MTANRISGMWVLSGLALLLALSAALPAQADPDLRVGYSFHAFDHLGNYGQQSGAAVACGVTAIYATGLGCYGYQGLPTREVWQAQCNAVREYSDQARKQGIKTVIGYLCATSIVGLDGFAKNWTDAQRAEFRSAPDTWLQQDLDGQPLPSWYGGEYRPACMNNPDWRAYEQYMIRVQLETGHDGIFFDNPTVHEKGCYCPHCMTKFAAFLRAEGQTVSDDSVAALRTLAVKREEAFKRFRCVTARDFIEAMRRYARTINPEAVITANNSLNSPDVLYSQCHVYGYNIGEMSKTEDFVVIEDMSSQPRRMADGKVVENAATYAQLQAIIHGKPLVAVTIAEGDYHTPPNLVKLAMAEAAAQQTSYLLWPTWPETERARMIQSVRPYADWLSAHAALLNASAPRSDVLVYLPFSQWVKRRQCAVTPLVQALTRANVQYAVVSGDNFAERLGAARVVLLENKKAVSGKEKGLLKDYRNVGGAVVLGDSADWLAAVQRATAPASLTIDGPDTLRGVVRDAPGQTMVMLYNLNVERISSFEDKVTPAENLTLTVSVPFAAVKSVTLSAADEGATTGPIAFTSSAEGKNQRTAITLPRLDVAAMIILDKE